MSHEPVLYASARCGCWSACRCGWQSERRYTSVTGAHCAFADHLLEIAGQQEGS